MSDIISDMKQREFSKHPTYPFPIPDFPDDISTNLASFPSSVGKIIDNQANLDLLYFEPYIPKYLEREVFQFLRSELPFYRVQYRIKRYGTESDIRTPRYIYPSLQCKLGDIDLR